MWKVNEKKNRRPCAWDSARSGGAQKPLSWRLGRLRGTLPSSFFALALEPVASDVSKAGLRRAAACRNLTCHASHDVRSGLALQCPLPAGIHADFTSVHRPSWLLWQATGPRTWLLHFARGLCWFRAFRVAPCLGCSVCVCGSRSSHKCQVPLHSSSLVLSTKND